MTKKRTKLIKGDAYELLKSIESESVDLIFTDPPYNIKKYSTGNINLKNRASINNDIADWDILDVDYELLSNEFKRILNPKGNIFIFTSYHTIGKWHFYLDPLFDTFQVFIWHKTNPTPKIHKNGFLNSCEIIVCAWNKGHNWNFSNQKEMHNFFESPICMGNERTKNPKHPTQKPLKIINHLLKIGSNKDGLVLDPFMGVGSVGVSAIQNSRSFIGIEIDNEFFRKAKDRIEEESAN
jgi:site-specific DNA-methyltransferase (adenine-specific)/modification methylase